MIYALIAGIHRLNKTKILQGNSSFQRIIGLKSFPYATSLRRFLKRVNPKTIQEINKFHDRLKLKMFYLPRPHTSLLFDFDSSVLTIYGKYIEKAKGGYNPYKKRGARSYHSLLCFKFHSKNFWHGVLRSGNVYTSADRFIVICRPLPKNIWHFYRGRAIIEKNIRELKEDLALAKIPTKNFLANQLYFYLLLLAYNIANCFKQLCLPPIFRNATLMSRNFKVHFNFPPLKKGD